MHRFFLPEDCFTQSSVVITGKLVHQLRNVLRLKAEDHIIVLDNSGWEYDVRLKALGGDKIEAEIVSESPVTGEPRARITLYQALLKASNFEVVLQKCTEIGVAGFVPIVCERCVADEPNSGKLSRWQNIIREAAEQSQRGKLPVLHKVTSFTEACESISGLSLLPWEGEKLRGIGKVLRNYPRTGRALDVSIFIGPEGGFTQREVGFAQSHGIMPVSLGPRILRAETAGLVAAAIALYELGEMDGI
jgi:16S rRNA (uracil1498-N3)-methyltransferase